MPIALPDPLVTDPQVQRNFDALRRLVPANAALKPGTQVRPQIMFVSSLYGADTADGLSWGSAKQTIEAAIAAMPVGGQILIEQGDYTPPDTLELSGHTLVGTVWGGSNSATARVSIHHSFNGDLVDFVRGGGLHNVELFQDGNLTGAAIKAVSTDALRVGGIYASNINVTGSAHGFERDLWLDGSGDSIGIRQTYFRDCIFFGAKTAGETVRLDRAIHCYFSNCEIIAAPENAVAQGLRITEALSEAIHWIGGQIIGSLSSAAQGKCIFFVDVSTATTFETGSTVQQLWGQSGTYTNNGNSTNQRGPVSNVFAEPTSFASEIIPDRVRLNERSDTGASPANSVLLFAMDNGAGKTKLMARFPSGAAVQVAIEP